MSQLSTGQQQLGDVKSRIVSKLNQPKPGARTKSSQPTKTRRKNPNSTIDTSDFFVVFTYCDIDLDHSKLKGRTHPKNQGVHSLKMLLFISETSTIPIYHPITSQYNLPLISTRSQSIATRSIQRRLAKASASLWKGKRHMRPVGMMSLKDHQ